MKITKQALQEYLQAEWQKEWRASWAVLSRRPINGYLGWNGFGNLGDEAVYEAYRLLFKKQNLIPVRLGPATMATVKLMGREVPMGFAALGGGTLINQNDMWLYQSEYLVERGVPMFCLGTGVASSSFWKDHPEVHKTDKLDRWVKLLEKFVYVGVRGPKAQATLRRAGFEAEVVGDAAIALAPKKVKTSTGRKIVGINVSRGTEGGMWGDADVFAREMTATVKQLVKEGFTVHLLPIWPGDMAVSTQIHAAAGSPDCRLVQAYVTTGQYMAALSQCDLFMGLKLHATILATMLRIPSIMLEYRPKCLDYMQSINMSEYSVRTNRVTAAGLVEKLHTLIDRYPAIASELDERILYYRQLQFDRAAAIQKKLSV